MVHCCWSGNCIIAERIADCKGNPNSCRTVSLSLCECITLPSARGAFCIVWADKWLKVPLPPALCHTDNTQPYCAIVLWGRSGFVWTPTMDGLAAGNPLIVIAGRSLSEIARASNLKGKLWHYFFTKFASFPQGEKDYSNTHYSEFI